MIDTSILDDCTLCPNKADPRCSIMTKDSDVYPLCDGCAPWDLDEARDVAERCRASGKKPKEAYNRFGHMEPRT